MTNLNPSLRVVNGLSTNVSRRNFLGGVAGLVGSAAVSPARCLRTNQLRLQASGSIRTPISQQGGRCGHRIHLGEDARSRTGVALLELPAQHARHHRHFTNGPPVLTPSSSPATFPPCGCAIPPRRCGPIFRSSPPIADLAQLIEGVIRRQTRCILADPYANAFMPDLASREPLSWSKTDHTDMKPGVGERKWEVDSLCYPVRLAHEYWRITHDTQPIRRGMGTCDAHHPRNLHGAAAQNLARTVLTSSARPSRPTTR